MNCLNRIILVSVLSTIAGAASAAPVLDVRFSSAPNVFGSTVSWNAYATNARNSLEFNLGDVGGSRATNPGAYTVAGATINPFDVVVSEFNSWLGQANPGGVAANEYGHRMHAGLHITSPGVNNKFTLEQLTFNMTSTDSGNVLDFNGNFIGLNYNGTTRYGIDYGIDGVKGGGDDIVYLTGNGTTGVNELVYVGVGNALVAANSEIGVTNQDKMDTVFAWMASEGQFQLNCTYSLVGPGGVIGSGSDSVTIIPTPGVISTLGLTGLAVIRRRRR